MDPKEIQTIVLACLRAVRVPRIQEETFSISDTPAEVGVRKIAKQNVVTGVFIATYEQYYQFRDCVNANGVYIARYIPYFFDDAGFLYRYRIYAVEDWRRRR